MELKIEGLDDFIRPMKKYFNKSTDAGYAE